MKQPISVKVPFDTGTVTMCMCPRCPVQGNSSCVTNKLTDLPGSLGKEPLSREDIPAVYCSSGKAVCPDLSFNERCQCGTCPVWHSYNLGSGQLNYHYCREGSAR